MATATTMPARGHSSAPKFTADQPRELQRYFQELEILLDSAHIVDAQIMKKHACRYLNVDSAELWELIAEYAAPSTFDEFKRAIFKLYPSSEDEHKWTITDMDKLVGEQLRVGILDANELGAYYRLFYMITQFLIRKNRISAAEQSRAFICGFQSDLWNRIQRQVP